MASRAAAAHGSNGVVVTSQQLLCIYPKIVWLIYGRENTKIPIGRPTFDLNFLVGGYII